jgi:hypothetical protein
MTALRVLVFDRNRGHPHLIFITLAAFWSFFATLPSPSPVPIVLTLSSVLLYSRIFLPSECPLQYAGFLFLALTSGGFLSRLTPSIHALSSPGISLLVLFAMSSITSFLTLGAAYIDTKLYDQFPSRWSQMTFFPALWATLWFVVSYASPIGRLSAWSPAEGLGLYGWIVQVVGAAGIDWVVAAWAVVCSQIAGVWFMGLEDEDEEPLMPHPGVGPGESRLLSHTSSISLLAALLVTLMLPSFVLSDIPLAAVSSGTTPLSVGCVMPAFHRYKHHSLTLDDYIAESRKLTGSAKILLWPEGAVTFNSEAEKEEGLAKVRTEITGSHVAVSFEETFASPTDPVGKSSRRTGLAIVSQSSASPHFEYYKRHLVPSMCFHLAAGFDVQLDFFSRRVFRVITFNSPPQHVYPRINSSKGYEQDRLGTGSELHPSYRVDCVNLS